MKIFDENMVLVENPDLEKGIVIEGQRPVTHRYIITTVEVGHYETIAEYPNGGKDVEWVVDTPEEGHWETYDEQGDKVDTEFIIPDDMPHEQEITDFETIGIYRLFTEEELKAKEEAERAANQPTQIDMVEAQAIYTAMMTDTLLEV